MSRLNAPRTTPYDFRVVEFDGWVWLFDDSSRTYPCSATPHIYIEALYSTGPDEDPGYYPDPGYITEATLRSLEGTQSVPVSCPFNMPHQEAWDDAHEEANANHLL